MKINRRTLLGLGASLPFLDLERALAAGRERLVFGLSTYPSTFSLWTQVGTAATTVKMMTHRGLLSFGPDGKVRGELAESFEAKSPTEWVFRLRKAVFHDGKPVTAADVKWSFEQIGAEKSTAYYRSTFQQFERIDTPDESTVVIVMKEPLSTLPLVLAMPHTMVVPKDSSLERGALPPGAGPYKMISQERGVAIEFERFDGFYKPGLPKPKTVRMAAYPDENLRVAALQSGDVDIIEYVPWQSMSSLEADPGLKLQSTYGPFMYLVFNGQQGPFKDARLRRAVAHAVNRDDIIKTAFFGRGAPLEGVPLAADSEFLDPAAARALAYDPAKAKALMAEAGVPNGFSCTLLSNAQYTMHRSTAEVVQQSLGAIGIQVELKLPDYAAYTTAGNRGQYEFAVVGNTADNNDPDGLTSLVDGTLTPSFVRSYGLAVPELHDLLVAGRREFDPAARKAIYAKMEKVLIDEAPIVGLAWRAQAYAMKKSVTGFANLPGQLTFYSGLTIEDVD